MYIFYDIIIIILINNDIMPNLSVTPILNYAINKQASDIHITEWSYIILRINWKLNILESTWKIQKIKINQILLELLNENTELIKFFIKNKDLDFSYISEQWITFRVNAYFKMWNISLILRKIEEKARTYDELQLPLWARNISKLKNWLVIVSWPSWSWKSSTINSILEDINKNRSEHIITLENPVEYKYINKKSVFSQRNIWSDTLSLKSWLKSVTREDANIVMIWEINSKETLEYAISMAESWILVITSINSSSTWDTINKLTWFYNNDEKDSINLKLWNILKYSIYQKLIDKKDWNWRISIFEIMIINENIKLLIRSWKMFELKDAISMSEKNWMISLKSYANMLLEKWLITKETIEENFNLE